MHRLDLPPPDADARALSERLVAVVAAEIEHAGPMPFQRYMELALYAPGLGYYVAGARKFGVHGDFVTAPELGHVYAQVLARALAPVLKSLEQPTLLELGAGSGVLAADLLLALAELDALPASYAILERSGELRERQAQTLAEHAPQWLTRVHWLEQPPTASYEGVVIGNEVVDALACVRFRVGERGVSELGVALGSLGLHECELPPRRHVRRALDELREQLPFALAPGYTSELLPELSAWFAAIAAGLERGLVLLADYGYGRAEYYRPERRDGTLQCHYRQRVHADPYWYPGLNDLTASVDFTALAEGAIAAGFELAGYDSQGGFLRAAGIDQVFERHAHASEIERLRVANEIRRLLLPAEMGERFKVFAASRGLDADVLGPAFAGLGQRHLL
jgi:SAM-dependent MidA family methyltransferase